MLSQKNRRGLNPKSTFLVELAFSRSSWQLAAFNRPLHKLLSSRRMAEREHIHSLFAGSEDDRAGFLSIHLDKTHRGTAIVNGSLRADCRHGAEAPEAVVLNCGADSVLRRTVRAAIRGRSAVRSR
jgi:hypothetical protein